MKTNMYVNNLINNAKLLGLGLVSVLVMGACKTYNHTVVGTCGGNQIMTTNDADEKYLIKCSKNGTAQNDRLIKDITYFLPGDKIKVQAKKPFLNYDGHRIIDTKDYSVKWDKDTMNIRKERLEMIKTCPSCMQEAQTRTSR